MCGRFLADLGADVIRVEPPGGGASRAQAPLHDGVSLPFAMHNAGKRGVVVDHTTTEGRDRLLRLLDSADIWIETTGPGALSELGLGAGRRPGAEPRPGCAVDHGLRSDRPLSRLGGDGLDAVGDGRCVEPVRPARPGAADATGGPGPSGHGDAGHVGGIGRRTGTGCSAAPGDHIDFSLYEATAQVIDPAMGTVGTAQVAGYEPTRGRPAPGPYPIFRCRDGHVRVVMLAPPAVARDARVAG